MKRIIYFMAAALLVFGLAACTAEDTPVVTETPTAEVTAAVTEPLPIEITTADFKAIVENGEATLIEYVGEGDGIGYEVVVPDSIEGYPVVAIGDYCFELNISIGSVKVPDGVTKLGRGAFKNCWKLKSVTLPDTLADLGISAFEGCRSLAALEIPSNVKSIGEKAVTADYGIALTVTAGSAAEEFAKANSIAYNVK